jgi:hypothetical protein
MVRAYNTIFVYPISSVTVRRMDSSTNIVKTSFPVEANTAMVNAFTNVMEPDTSSIQNNPCPDCAVPVDDDFLSTTTYGIQPQPTVNLTPPDDGCDADTDQNCTIQENPQADSNIVRASKAIKTIAPKIISNVTCVPSTFVMTDHGVCVSSSTVDGRHSNNMHPDFVGGKGRAYVWYYSCYTTELIAQLNAMTEAHHPIIWNAAYQDRAGYAGVSRGTEHANASGQLGWKVKPSFTYFSVMAASMTDSLTERGLGDATGFTAVPYWSGCLN